NELLPEERGTDLLRKAIQGFPNDYRLCTVLAYRLLRERPPREEEALGHARTALALRANSFAFLTVALCLRGEANRDEAIGYAQAAVHRDSQNVLAHIVLGRKLLDRGERAAGIANLQKASALRPDDTRPLLALAEEFVNDGDWRQAIDACNAIVQREPKHIDARVYLGLAFAGQGDSDRAIATIEEAFAQDRDNARRCVALAWVLERKNDPNAAVAMLSKAIAIDPKNAHAHDFLGEIRRKMGDVNGAVAMFKKVAELDPRDARNHFNLGTVLCQIGDFPSAISSLNRSIELDSRHAPAFFQLGLAHWAKGSVFAAIDANQNAIQRNPKHAGTHYNLGLCYLQRGGLDSLSLAREETKKAIQLADEGELLIDNYRSLLARIEALQRFDVGEIMDGKIKAANFEEEIQFASLCRGRGHYSVAVRFFDQASEDAKRIHSSEWTNFAQVYLLAANGTGFDPVPRADGKERSRLRKEALRWLRFYLRLQEQELRKNHTSYRIAFQYNVRGLLHHQDYSSVRYPLLYELPENERVEWHAFWSDVQRLLNRAGLRDPDAKEG
ncbi:MAG TPA: tetratricopeptide repeat protein, partial [Gemmataceae bacterium]|nr:tetratricopeptide repeat protein [Gemmataceae bacterium]